MNATDVLKRMLDERGIHWWAGTDEHKTLWESNGLTWEYFNDENGDAWLGFLGACEQDITPEQAIAATLGTKRDRTEEWLMNACNQASADYIAELERKLEAATLGNGKLTAEQVRRCVRVGACDHGLWEAIDEDTDWQEIADGLNAVLGGGECEVIKCDKGKMKCSKCGKELPYDPFADYECNFCPTCGARLRYGRR